MNTKKILSLFILLSTIGTAYSLTEDELKKELLKMAQETLAYKRYKNYQEAKNNMSHQLTLYQTVCKESSAAPNTTPSNPNPCSLLAAFEAYQKEFDPEYKRIKDNAENTPEAIVYKTRSGIKQLISDDKNKYMS